VSGEIKGLTEDAGYVEPDDGSAEELLELVLAPEHVWNEINAFDCAWQGSIEETGIPATMKNQAFSHRRFRELFYEFLLPHVWLPKKPDDRPPEGSPVGDYTPKNLEEVREKLHNEEFCRNLSGDKLLSFLEWAMLLYGIELDQSDIPPVGNLYASAVEKTNPEHRKLTMLELTKMIEILKAPAASYMPILVFEPELSIASTAALDFAALSPLVENGLPYAFKEIDLLLQQGSIRNPGAVFGGLVSLGDRRLSPELKRLRQYLKREDVLVAVQAYSGFMSHAGIQFWLSWAEEVVENEDLEGIFGSITSALTIIPNRATESIVRDVERVFPCTDAEVSVVELKKWDKPEYAKYIAPRLYALEKAETPPKLFSYVLHCWNLPPAAPLEERFIPDE
jgi:hypothetical protein